MHNCACLLSDQCWINVGPMWTWLPHQGVLVVHSLCICLIPLIGNRGVHSSPNHTQIMTQITTQIMMQVTPNLGPKFRFEDLVSWSSRGPNAQMCKSFCPNPIPKYRYQIQICIT